MTDSGWRPLRKPDRARPGAEGFAVSPFVRLARVHAVAAASDGAVTAALAGSIFFSISPEESRARVALALLLTMAPFAVVTPLIGPVIDRARGGRRLMILATLVARAVLAFLMIGHFDTLWLFPEAFGVLVLQKSYAVAKSAVVPQLVDREDDFVRANSRLALLSSIAGPLGAGVAGAFSALGGPAIAAALGMVGFIVAAVLSAQLPRIVVAASPVEAEERSELRDAKILLAATVMAALRAAVGFVTMLLMFELRGGKDGIDVSTDGAAWGGATATVRGIDITGDPRASAWEFALVALFAVGGSLTGARVAPAVRRRVIEERILAGSLAMVVVAALYAATSTSALSTAVLAGAVSMATVTGKLAFDALVQRDAPDANHGRSFARFEARFQLTFAAGAFLPVMIRMGVSVGAWVVALVGGGILVSYLMGGPGRGGWRRPVLPRPRRSAAPESAASSPPTSPYETADPTLEFGADDVEFGTDDIHPSQPAPPAATAEVGPPEWDETAPYVSSIDGVEVDPSPPGAAAPDAGDEPPR